MKKAMSVTIREDNFLWLKGQAAATTGGNVSEVLDRLVQQARTGGVQTTSRSVVGTIDLPEGALETADAYVRTLFDRSLARPARVRERPPARKRARRG
jgi:hypothetical protein